MVNYKSKPSEDLLKTYIFNIGWCEKLSKNCKRGSREQMDLEEEGEIGHTLDLKSHRSKACSIEELTSKAKNWSLLQKFAK
jgi:G:T-mismatch repair DNA endonuclease (very short patch repair protein)